MPFIPVTNIKTGKITGCKKGTIEYEHELAHKKFSESNLGMNIQFLGEISEFWTIITIVLTFFFNPIKWFALIGVFFMLFSFIFEELYCNSEASENVNKRITKDLNMR